MKRAKRALALEGLGWISGKVVRLPDGVMIPQMGWNSLSIKRPVEMLEGISDGDMFYFVHSYYGQPKDRSVIVATTEHGVEVTAAVAKDNLFATQFHPEKSGAKGLKILENFVRCIRLLARRIIPCLDCDLGVPGGRVVKGIEFKQIRYAGDSLGAGRQVLRGRRR